MFMFRKDTRAFGSGQIKSALGSADLLTDLYGKLEDRLNEVLCLKGTFVMCGEIGPNSRVAAEWAAQQDATMLVVDESSLSLDWLKSYADRLDFLLMDADYMADTEETVDFCLRIRRAVPNLVLILISSEVQEHDLTCERMMACDATLKSPLRRRILADGVRAARQNHSYFLSTRN